MRRLLPTAGLLLAALAAPLAADDAKGTRVTLDNITSTTPATWVSEKPASTMRFAQFRLPKAKGDKHDAQLIIFKGLGGSAKDNIKRWKTEFVAPKGKSIDDVSKVADISIADLDGKRLDISGTFLFKAQPFNPKAKAEEREDYKMIAIQLEGPDNRYHIKLVGPAKTIDAHAKAFEAWLKGFKKQ